MSRAADLMHQKLYPEAVKELNLALAASPGSSEVGFVMGELLRQREKRMEAASLYAEILDRDPDFPETHSKLAFVLYRLGDQDRAIRESKEALVRNPDNPEAHKNMRLALNVKRSFDAASRNTVRRCARSPTIRLSITTWESSLSTGVIIKALSWNTRRRSRWIRNSPTVTTIWGSLSKKRRY